GVMLALVACAAIVSAGSAGTKPRSRVARWSAAPRVVAGVGVVLAIVGFLLVRSGIDHELGEEQAALRTRAFDPATSREAFHGHVRVAMSRHPAEPYFPFAGALRASRARDESVM